MIIYFFFTDNPIKCDCRLQWVKIYIHLNTSHQFTKELQELHCRPDGENQTRQVVHLLQCSGTTGDHHFRTTNDQVPGTTQDNVFEITMDHGSAKAKNHGPGITSKNVPETTKDHVPSSIERASSLVPYGIQSERRNKTRTVVEMMPEIQDAEAVEEDNDKSEGSPSGSKTLVGDARLVLLVTLAAGFLLRRRKGTTPW